MIAPIAHISTSGSIKHDASTENIKNQISKHKQKAVNLSKRMSLEDGMSTINHTDRESHLKMMPDQRREAKKRRCWTRKFSGCFILHFHNHIFGEAIDVINTVITCFFSHLIKVMAVKLIATDINKKSFWSTKTKGSRINLWSITMRKRDTRKPNTV